jgi:hypothetical protein
MIFATCVILFSILYVWIGWYQPAQQIKKSSFSEKRKWVERLRD